MAIDVVTCLNILKDNDINENGFCFCLSYWKIILIISSHKRGNDAKFALNPNALIYTHRDTEYDKYVFVLKKNGIYNTYIS